jgi:hypothetical protein
MMYYIYDTQGSLVGKFKSYQAAFTFLISRGRYDWKISNTNSKILKYEKR